MPEVRSHRSEVSRPRLGSGVPRPARMMPGTACCLMMEPVKLTAQTFEHACDGVLMLATIG